MRCVSQPAWRSEIQPFQKPVAWLLICLLGWQPVLSIADVVPTAPNGVRPTLDAAANGVPVINIAAPNAAGLSKNLYSSFDVENRGVVLNNGATVSNTSLAGHIEGNPNLARGEASLILNQVIGGNSTTMQGYVEVGGRKADVVVANPFGITCNGCGFINTSRATLTTGDPLFDSDGGLSGFDVRSGVVSFDGLASVNTAADRFDVIARSVTFNSELFAKDLNIVTGQQQVAYASLGLSGIATDASAPTFSIDSTLLGGIYADRIRLIGSEQGVGVRLSAPVAAQTGDLEISSQGDIRYARLSAAESLRLQAADTIYAEDSASAAGDINVSADQIFLEGGTLEGQGVTLSSSSIDIDADAAIDADIFVLDAESFLNGGTIAVGNDGRIIVRSLENQGDIRSEQNLQIDSSQLQNVGGNIQSFGGLHISTNDFVYQGNIQADGLLDIVALQNITVDALSEWKVLGALSLTAGDSFLNEGVMSTGGTLDLYATHIVNRGDIASYGSSALTADDIVNDASALILSNNNLLMFARSLSNSGDLYAIGNVSFSAEDYTSADLFYNASGFVAAEQGSLSLYAADIVNTRTVLPETELYLQTDRTEYHDGAGRSPAQHQTCFKHSRDGGCRSFVAVRYSYVDQHARFTDQLPEAGFLYAGGNIDVRGGRFSNQYSDVIAGNDIHFDVIDFENLVFSQTVHDQLRVDRSWHEEDDGGLFHSDDHYTNTTIEYSEDPGFCNDAGRHRCHRYVYYSGPSSPRVPTSNRHYIWASEVESVEPVMVPKEVCGRMGCHTVYEQKYLMTRTNGSEITVDSYSEQFAPSITETRREEVMLSANIRAGNNLIITADNEVRQGVAEGMANIAFPSGLTGYRESASGEMGNVYRFDPLAMGGFTLPGDHGLFVRAAPDSPYLIATNSLFTHYDEFMGSTYMLRRLGWDPTGLYLLLGDAFYEMQLLEKALRGSGRISAGSDYEQQAQLFTTMMDQGIAAAESLDLAVGVSLSAEQVNALQQDIVWLEEREVVGQKVLVPVVYLAGGTQAGVAATVAANNVEITAGQINNGGNIESYSNAALTSTGGSITNSGSIQAQGNIDLNSAADIANTSGQMMASSINMTAAGDVLNDVAVQETVGNNIQATALGRAGSITADDALVISAGGDIVNRGANVSAGQLSMTAGGDIVIAAQRASDNWDAAQGNATSSSSTVRQLSANIQSSMSAMLTAGDAIRIVGSNVSAGEDMALYAGGGIEVLAALETHEGQSTVKQDLDFGRREKEFSSMATQTVVASSLSAGDDLLINTVEVKDAAGSRFVGYEGAGGDVRISASDLISGDVLAISVPGTLSLETQAEMMAQSRSSEKYGIVSTRVSMQESLDIEHRGATLSSGGAMNLMALDDINMLNADLDSAENMTLLSGAWYDDGSGWQSNQNAAIRIGAVEDTHQSHSYYYSAKMDWKAVAVGVMTAGMASGFSFAVGDPFGGIKTMDNGFQAGLDAKSGRVRDASDSAWLVQGSSLHANGNVNVLAAGDVMLTASSIGSVDESGVPGANAYVSAGSLNLGGNLIENDDASIYLFAQHDRYESYLFEESFQADYMGLAAGILVQSAANTMNNVMGGQFTGASPPSSAEQIQSLATSFERDEVTASRQELVGSSITSSGSATLLASQDITTVGATVQTAGDLSLLAGGDINVLAGYNLASETRRHEEQSFDNLVGGYDHGRLYAGMEANKLASMSYSEKQTAIGSLLSAGGNLNLASAGDVLVVGSDGVASYINVDANGDVMIREAEEYELHRDTESDETLRLTAGIGNKYVDTAYAVDDYVKASEAVKAAYDALQQAKENPRIEDVSDYEANLALAILQQQAIGLQVAASVAGSAETTTSLGFYGNVKLDHEKRETTSHSKMEFGRGSSLIATNDIDINSKNTATLQGSQLASGEGNVSLTAEDISILASANTTTAGSRTKESSQSLTLASSAQSDMAAALAIENLTSLSGGLGYSESEMSSRATSWQNAGITADNGVVTLNAVRDIEIKGANVSADKIALTAENLTVASLQNTSESEYSNRGMNLGGGSGGAINGGFNDAHGSSERGWVDMQTVLWGNSAVDIDIASHTALEGAVIGSDGQGGLTLDTGTFSYSDIQDYDYSSNRGWGVSTSLNPLDFAESGRTPQGSTTLNFSRGGVAREQVSRATITTGAINVRDASHSDALEGLNRDVTQAQTLLLDEVTGGLNATLTVDHRLMSASGREEIITQIDQLGSNWQYWGRNLDYQFQAYLTEPLEGMAGDSKVADFLLGGLLALDTASLGLLPLDKRDNGGVASQLPGLFGSADVFSRQLVLVSTNTDYYQNNADNLVFKPIEEHPLYDDLSDERKLKMAGLVYADVTGGISTATATYQNFTNGMFNTEAEGLANAFTQTHVVGPNGVADGQVAVTLNYNPRHGFLGDMLEIGVDKVGSSGLLPAFGSGMAMQTADFFVTTYDARLGMGINYAAHSQGNILGYSALNMLDASDFKTGNPEQGGVTYMAFGSPVNNAAMQSMLSGYGFTYVSSVAAENDFVAEALGGNYGTHLQGSMPSRYSNVPVRIVQAPEQILINSVRLFDVLGPSPHSSYDCQAATGNCGYRP